MAMDTKRSLKEVQEYVWAKYIDAQKVDSDLTDEEALQLLEESFYQLDLDQNPDFYMYGVILFEMAFLDESVQLAYFCRAKRILEKWRSTSGETDWEEINDRIEEINDFLADEDVLKTVEAAGDILLAPDLDIEAFLEERKRFPNFPRGMVLVPGGEFPYGTDGDTASVEPFLIDAHPVTNAQYLEFLEETGYRAPKFWKDDRFNQPQQPVVGISLNDAKKYAKWANKDIPTEQQWEKAARGVDGRTYPWGEEVRGKGEFYDLDPSVAACAEVGKADDMASPFGCHEMAGFVWQWTKTLWESGTKVRVLRGGSWADDERFVTCTFRLAAKEREKADNVGFRCCINAES